jgi:hypothetical protein
VHKGYWWEGEKERDRDVYGRIILKLILTMIIGVVIAQTGWTVRGSNPGGGGARFSTPVQTGPGAQPASNTKDILSLPGVKRSGRGVEHPPHLATRLKEE